MTGDDVCEDAVLKVNQQVSLATGKIKISKYIYYMDI